MRRFFLHISVSVDGYIDDGPGGLDWTSADGLEQHHDQVLDSIDGMIFGRVTFDQLATFWPTAEPGPGVTATQIQRMNELPKYVLTSDPSGAPEWNNTHFLTGDTRAALADLKQQDGGDVAIFAGSRAAATVLDSGTIDELQLIVHPVLLGTGTRLFDHGYPRSELRLSDTRRFDSGALFISYDVRRPA